MNVKTEVLVHAIMGITACKIYLLLYLYPSIIICLIELIGIGNGDSTAKYIAFELDLLYNGQNKPKIKVKLSYNISIKAGRNTTVLY